MISVWAESPRLPWEVAEAATRHAQELGRVVVSDDLFLLALTDLDESRPAKMALASAGVSSDQLLPHIRTSGDNASQPSERGVHFAPAFYTLQGLAQGFAASLGDGTISSEHVLLAILWTGNSCSLPLLQRLDVTRERLVHELIQLGIPVPQADLPPLVELEWGERVWFERDQIDTVLDHVRLHLDPATHWGFNYEGDRAWIDAESSVDMDALVREALSAG